MPFIKACLNGGRTKAHSGAVPVTPAEVAREAAEAVEAGADAVHVHVRSEDGEQSLAASDVAATMLAVREAVSVPVGVTTGAWIVSGEARLALVQEWTELPDFASVNFSEDGAEELAGVLRSRGVGVEAGLWTASDAAWLVESGLAGDCVRLLFEPMDEDLEAAREVVRGMELALEGVAPEVPRLLHGRRNTTWPLFLDAVRAGYQTRIGFEDTLTVANQAAAESNRDLVAVAVKLAERLGG